MKKVLLIMLICLVWILLTGCWWNKKTEIDEWDVELSQNLDNEPAVVENEVSSFSVQTSIRDSMPWEDIYVYDDNDNLVLSLDDENQPQYLFALYENFLVLDRGTSASQREFLVYDIPSGRVVYKIDYYPWENWLVLNDNNIKFYKKIDKSAYWEYTLPECENEYDNGYIESYGYTIWEDQANDLGDIQCAYFE